MRKSVFPRFLIILFLYCAVFILLVTVQFARRGDFSHKIGGMTVSGRYLQTDAGGEEAQDGRQRLDGGASVFFGGLEFLLSPSSKTDAGLFLANMDDERWQVFPEYIAMAEDEAVFTLPGEAELSFIGQQNANGQPELRITGQFPPEVSAIGIPFKMQRSSVIRDKEPMTLNILYNGSRYQFSRNLPDLEDGLVILLPSMPSVSYRVLPDKQEINPADFIIHQAETPQAFSEVISLWTSRNFQLWNQNVRSFADEDTMVAWCAELIRRGNFGPAVTAVPPGLSSGLQRTWESAVYQIDQRTGLWERSVRAIGAAENEKLGRISGMIAEKNTDVFTEENLIEFLAIRGNDQLIENVLSLVGGMDDSMLSPEIIPGILENNINLRKWRPRGEDPFEALTEQACRLAAKGLIKNGEQVFVFFENQASIAYNLRLGMALRKWGEESGKNDWAGLGRSLVLSVISLGDDGGLVPATLTNGNGVYFSPSVEKYNTAFLYRRISGNEYLPHAAATGTNGVWAWTASSSVNVTQNDRQIDIYTTFPTGETHYVMLRNIRPFALLRIYDQNWRSASDFESYYGSSGWYYFESERTLVIKLKHRSNTEYVRILFTAPPPPPRPQPAPTPAPPPAPAPERPPEAVPAGE
jgi:hypothetical protein